PGFDRLQDNDDDLVQANWEPETEWVAPPADAPFNTTTINVRAGAFGDAGGYVLTAGAFHAVRVEIQPNPNQDPAHRLDEGVMRLFVNGVELFPNGDSSQRWIAARTN